MKIDGDIKKKEVLKRQQEILDLQLAMKLAQLEETVSSVADQDETGSVLYKEAVVSDNPDVQKWMKGQVPWKKHFEVEVTEISSENKVSHNKSRRGSEFYSNNTEKYIMENKSVSTRQCQMIDTDMRKILTRLGVPEDLPIFNGDPTEWPNFIHQYRNSTAICGFTNEENQCQFQKFMLQR